MWWVGLIELILFALIGAVVLWVFFKPVAQSNKSHPDHPTKKD